MEITSKTTERYVPKAYGNRELPEHEQIVCVLSHPNSETFDNRYAATGTKGFNGTAIVKDRVKSITNLTVDGVEITNGTDLVTKCKRADVYDLVAELIYCFLSGAGIAEDDEKN